MLARPGTLKHIVRVQWKSLAEALVHKIFNSPLKQSFYSIPKETGDIESEWTVFSTSTAKATALSYGCKVVTACHISHLL